MWAFKRSVGGKHRAPLITSVAILWSFVNSLSAPTEPKVLFLPISLLGGVYQVSSPYIILGTATARYNCHICLDDSPEAGLVRRQNSRVQVVALVIALRDCIVHQSWLST